MAETSQKRITLSNFFEQIVEIDKVANKALKQSNESVSISERTKLDLERLIQTLRITFDGDSANVQPAGSVTNITQNNKEITKIIREDAIEDREIRDAFTQLQTSFNNLTNIVYVLRNDLQSTTGALIEMQQGRSRMLREQGRVVSKEEDTLQKEQILGVKQKQQTQQVQDQKRQQEQRENKALGALKGLLGGGLIAGLGGLLGNNLEDPLDIPTAGDLSGGQKEAENKTFDYLSKNYGKNVAYGMLSNAMRESGYRTETGGEYYGMFQLDKNRKQRLFEYAKSKGKSPTDRGIQTEFAIIEAEESGTLGRMKAAKTPEEASSIFYNEFEKAQYSRPIVGEKNYDPNNPHEKKNREYLIEIRKRQELREKQEREKNKQSVSPEKNNLKISGNYTEEQMQQYYADKGQTMPSYLLSSVQSKTDKLSQSYLAPQERQKLSSLTKPMTPEVASITLPPINAGTQQVASITLPPINAGTQQVGGQGRGQAATHSYAVNSAKNEMMFAQVLTTSFSDKMNIVMG